MVGLVVTLALAQASMVLPPSGPLSFPAGFIPWPIVADAGFAAAHDGVDSQSSRRFVFFGGAARG